MAIDSISLNNNTGISINPVETANNPIKTKPYPNDTVELSGKTKTDTKKKNMLAVGGGLLAAGVLVTTAALLFIKHQGNKISKLYKDKLVMSNLPEHIDFKEAKTIDEGVEFAKKTLGVKEVDKDFTLEAINIANKGLVDVSNANKGKLFVPTRLGFEKSEEENGNSTIAYVVNNINSPKFGNLVINRDYFDKEFLNKRINQMLFKSDKSPIYVIKDSKATSIGLRYGMFYLSPKKDAADLIQKYYNDSASLTINEQRALFYSLSEAISNGLRSYRNPLESLKLISNKVGKELKENNLEINWEEVKKLGTDKQAEYLMDLVKKLNDKYVFFKKGFGLETPATTIYHEMGHLQDFAKNLKELDIKKWKFSFKDAWKNSKHKAETGEDLSRSGVDEVNNRWGCIWNEKYEKLLNENPNEFKKLYPDLYEFVTNQSTQLSAGKVSEYAQSGIGEFIAEVYKNKIAKQKIPSDVEALYKKYNGPEISG